MGEIGTKLQREESVQAWLWVDGERAVPLELANTSLRRLKGLIGRPTIEGAMLLSPARSVHTFGMRFSIDVAHLDSQLRVLRITTMKPQRVGRICWRARHVLEMRSGAMAPLGIALGTQLAIGR